MPGEIEARHRADRTANGIELDDITWQQITDIAASVGIEL
jgi:LDH2 family malate/lactate/ureidoglycolate dehydrogenase